MTKGDEKVTKNMSKKVPKVTKCYQKDVKRGAEKVPNGDQEDVHKGAEKVTNMCSNR